MFNTVQYDSTTKDRMMTFDYILMNNFTRFEVNLIALENGITFDWGVTSKRALIMMLKERNALVPTLEEMNQFKENHRMRTQEANNVIEQKAAIDELIEPEIEESITLKELDKLKRHELVKLAAKYEIIDPIRKKNDELREELSNVEDLIRIN